MNTEDQMNSEGLYLRGTVINANARAFQNKDDGSVTVMITHEIAYGGELLSWTRYVKPHEEPAIKMAGMEVVDFPKHERYQPIALKVLRTKVYNGRFSVTSAEVIEAA